MPRRCQSALRSQLVPPLSARGGSPVLAATAALPPRSSAWLRDIGTVVLLYSVRCASGSSIVAGVRLPDLEPRDKETSEPVFDRLVLLLPHVVVGVPLDCSRS